MDELVALVVECSEKAAEIARIMRKEGSFDTLVEEKAEREKNPKFKHDFKTLADVLVQETIRRDMSMKFPGLSQSIFGEESGKFTTSDGREIVMNIGENPCATEDLLLSVIGKDNKRTASLLAECIHSESKVPFQFQQDSSATQLKNLKLDLENLGIWIDPIDATNEYVAGQDHHEALSGVYPRGLQVVTVLIGVFDVVTKLPILGVVNQPFWEKVGPNQWQGRYVWGVCCGGVKVSESTTGLLGTSEDDCSSCVLVTSYSLKKEIEDKLSKSDDFHIIKASGAGYKLLCVIDGLAAVHINEKDTTYFWDTCGPHAILLAVGGGIVSFTAAVEAKSSLFQIQYGVKLAGAPAEEYCNKCGFLAYRSQTALEMVLETLKQ